jgi:hypothetical protein
MMRRKFSSAETAASTVGERIALEENVSRPTREASPKL